MFKARRNRLAHLGAMVALGLTAFGGVASAQYPVAGNYTFDDTLTGLIGQPLTATGTFSYATLYVGIREARVAHFPANSYFTVDHRMAPNGGGIYVNQYSLIMDILLTDMPSGWCSLLQTQEAAPFTNDGDWFIRGSDRGIGISGDYTDTGNNLRFSLNVWRRVVLIIDTTTPTGSLDTKYATYLNGVRQNVVQSPDGWGRDGRFSLGPVFHMFADNSGDTSDVYINNFQVRNYAMSADEIAALGGPTVGPIPVPDVTLSGTLNLQGIDSSAAAQTIDFILRPSNGTGDLNRSAQVDPNGAFQLTVPPNSYNVRAKGTNYLADVFSVDARNGSVSGLSATLRGGDANNDNVVNVLDLDQLIVAFDTTPASENWNNGVADFNHDNVINVLDLDILITNFDTSGEDLP